MSSPPARRTRAVPRLPILIVAVVVIVVAVLVDTRVSRPVPAGSPAPAGALAAPSSAESSSWYCAGAPGTPGGPAVQRLYLANTTSAPVDGLMTVVNSAGLTTTAPVTVPARGQLVAVPQNVLTGPWLAEQVDQIAPRVVVTLGNFATRLLLDTDQGITRLRGASYPMGDTVLVPTFHPAAALRGGGVVLAQMRADLVRAKQLIGLGS